MYVNWTLLSLNGDSFEITLTVPLIRKSIYNKIIFVSPKFVVDLKQKEKHGVFRFKSNNRFKMFTTFFLCNTAAKF